VEAVDHFAANLAAQGTPATFKTVWALLLPVITIKPTGSTTAGSTTGSTSASLGASVPQIKVFTGVVSQGTLGAKTEFVARENDIIESIEELQQSAINNLVPFVASLSGRIVYELKIVSSVLTADGFPSQWYNTARSFGL
jgi:hypothetical protein